MKSLLLFAISLFSFSPFCFTQTVWPGDVNNNGVVNEVDLLYLGFAFNAIGNPRANPTTDFIGQEITTIWEGTFPDGLNFAFADCNGDGKVNLDDAAIIELNASLTHDDVPFIPDEIPEAVQGIDAQFFFSDTIITVKPNVRADVRIFLGGEGKLIDSLIGVSFNIRIGPKYFQTSRSQFELDEVAWITPFSGAFSSLSLPDTSNGTIKVAVAQTPQQAVTGSGFIGMVSFVIIEDAIDLLMGSNDTLKVVIDSVIVVNNDFEKIPVVGATLIVEVEGRITSNYNPILDKIKFYPNPNNGWLLLKSKEVAIEKVELVNTLGQVVYQKQLTNSTFQSLDLQAIPEGMYWLRMITKLGTKSTPIQRL